MDPHPTHDSYGPSKPTTQTAPYQFSRLCTDDRRVFLYFTMGRPFSQKSLPLPVGGSGPPSNTWFPGPTQILNPNGSSIGAAVLAGLASVTNRQTNRPTDHATRSLRIGRIYVCGCLLVNVNSRSRSLYAVAVRLSSVCLSVVCR